MSKEIIAFNNAIDVSPMYNPLSKGNYSLDKILEDVCNYYNLKIDFVKSNDRYQHLVNARQLYCYLCRNYTVASLSEIGNLINRDHSTVVWSVNKIKDFIDVDKYISRDIEFIVNSDKEVYREDVRKVVNQIRDSYGKGY
jgi:chromosomal replication initiator protein